MSVSAVLNNYFVVLMKRELAVARANQATQSTIHAVECSYNRAPFDLGTMCVGIVAWDSWELHHKSCYLVFHSCG